MKEAVNAKTGGGETAMHIRTILVPIDFSPQSIEALDYAHALGARFGGELHVSYVLEPDYAYAVPSLLEFPPFTVPGESEQQVRSELESVTAKYSIAGKPATAHAGFGRAFDQICKLATEIQADLIVLSTHGYTGLKHVLLGSTAERVVRHAPCPVLVVRQRGADTGPAPELKSAPTLEIRKLLVPIDFSDCSRDGLSYAIRLAKATGGSLVLLHALKLLPYVTPDRFALYDAMPSPESLTQMAEEQMQKFVAEVEFNGVPFEAKVELGHPAHEICDYAENCGADLIVTSTHGVTGLAHVLIGSVAEHVVRYARCPVLVVPRSVKSA